MSLEILGWMLMFGGGLQLLVAVLNLFLVDMLGWKNDLERMPLLIKEVFQVHKYFITITLTIFGLMTLGFLGEITGAATPMARCLALGIGLFWLIRAAVQVGYYSRVHWVGKIAETAVHYALVVTYTWLGLIYVIAAAGVL